MRDPYELLQVSPSAEIEVIEVAYRRLARKYHPDTNPSPDANEKMKDLNWAYEILKDPNKRGIIDRERMASQNTYKQASDNKNNEKVPNNVQKSTSSYPKYSPPKEKNFFRKYWIYIAIAVIVYIIFINPILRNSSITSQGQPIINNPQIDPYADCINWTLAKNYDSQKVCILGRILIVEEDYDVNSGSNVWTAHFSFDTHNDLSLISVDRDISQWQGKCVVVYGTLMNRDDVREYLQDPQPSMVDSDPFDTRGFTITSAPDNKC